MTEEVFITRLGGDRFAVSLPPAVRALVGDLIRQLRDLLVHEPGDPLLQRLFPPAYTDEDDADAEREYRRLVGDDLLSGRLSALDILEDSLDHGELDEPEMLAWVAALNDMRLVIGTRLDVDEDGEQDDDDEETGPEAELHHVYRFLTGLVGLFVEALAGWSEEDLTKAPPPGY